MSSWSANFSRNTRTTLKSTSSFDYQHGHSDSSSVEGGKAFRSQGSSKGWDSKTDGTANFRQGGPMNNYPQREGADSGQPFRSWNDKPEWRSNAVNQEGSGVPLLANSQNRSDILQTSFNWLPDVSLEKKSMDMLLKTHQDIGLLGQSAHSSGFSDKSYSSQIADIDSIGSNGRNMAYNSLDPAAYQRKKTSKAFDYLKTWRLKMNMPTDSFMVEKEISELSKRQNSGSSVLDTPPPQNTDYNQTAVNLGSTRSTSMDERNYSSNPLSKKEYVAHSSDAQFERHLYGSSDGHFPNVDHSVKGGGRVSEPSWKWRNNAQTNQVSGYKRNYTTVMTSQTSVKTGGRDPSPLSGPLGAKRPRLPESLQENPRHVSQQYDGSYQDQPFGLENVSNLYTSSDWKNQAPFTKRGSSDWASRSEAQSLEPIADNWIGSHRQSGSQSPRRANGGNSPQQPNWSDAAGLLQRNCGESYPRRLSPRGRSPEPSSSTRLLSATRGRSPGPITSKARSPGAPRGRSPRLPKRCSPGSVASRGKSPGSFRGRSPRFSPKGRSPTLLQRGKSPGIPCKQRSRGPSSRGKSPRPLSRGRSPRQHNRRSVSPLAERLSSRLARGRSSGSQRSAEHSSRGKSPVQSASSRLQYQHTRGRSPRRNTCDRSHGHHASKSPTVTQRTSQKSSDERSPVGRRRSPGHFRKKGSPGGRGRSRSPGFVGRDRSPRHMGRNRTPDHVGRGRSPRHLNRARSPRQFSKDRVSGYIERDESLRYGDKDRFLGSRSPSSASRGRSPGHLQRDKSPRGNGRGRSFDNRRKSEERIGRLSDQVTKGRSPILVTKSIVRQSSRQKEKRWFEEAVEEIDKKQPNQRKRTASLTRGRSAHGSPKALHGGKSVDRQSPNRFETIRRSPLFDELSPSPRSSNFWSPCHESLQGKKPQHRRRGSWSPVDLQRGCSPVSPQPTFELSDSWSNHVEGSPLPSSSHSIMKGSKAQSSNLQRGCSPVSPEGYSRPWSNSIDSRDLLELKRSTSKPSSRYEGKASLEEFSDSCGFNEENSRDDLQSPLNDGGNEIGKGDEDDEDLRVHLLRLREQKVEMKLRMLEEESIETELKLWQLENRRILEDNEEFSGKHDRRFLSNRDPEGGRGSRGKSSRSSSSSRRLLSHTEDHREVEFRRESPLRELPDSRRKQRGQHPRLSPHTDRRFQRKGRY